MLIQNHAWIRHYAYRAMQALLSPAKEYPPCLTFVIPEQSKGWILDAICRELANYYPDKSRLFYHDGQSPLPESSAYFFVHYNQLFAALSRQRSVWKAKRYVWYTHNSDDLCGAKPSEIPFVLNRMTRVFTTNTAVQQDLVAQGVSQQRLQTLLGAADPQLFTPASRRGKTVGLSTAYYARKNPALLAAIIDGMPDVTFILVGKDWEKWSGFKQMSARKNFHYITAGYSQYPAIYRQFDVYLSTSTLEGGPIPLIETMMCNVMPVVSDTGFCRDLIRHGENGFIFPVDSHHTKVIALIRQALSCTAPVAESVKHLSWRRMSHELHRAVIQS